MSAVEIHNAVVDMISELKVLTGANLSTDKKEQAAQIEVIKRFLYTGFNMLSKDEIVHAFYLNSIGVLERSTNGDVFRYYNKELNVEFIGDVLRAFLKYKVWIRQNKGEVIDKAMMITMPVQSETIQVDLDFWKELIQEEFEAYCRGLHTMQMWSTRKYYVLRQAGLIPFTKGIATWLFFAKKILNYTSGTKLPAGADITNYQFMKVSDVASLFHSAQDWKLFLLHVREFMYWYVLTACKQCGINNLFTDIQPE